jgi:hypothetical protein
VRGRVGPSDGFAYPRVDLENIAISLEAVVLPLEFMIAAIALMTVGCTAGKTATLPRPSLSSETAGEPHAAPGGLPTACQLRLTPDRALFEPLGAIAGAGECDGPDIVC